MGWIQTLAETYDKCESEVGKIVRNEKGQLITLLPIAHSINNTQIEITLDENANLIDARRLSKEDQNTIMPITEDSQARSNGIFPMPLCDKLCYLAKDYDEYSENDKKYKEYYEKYIDNLRRWVKVPNTHSDVKIIYKYLTSCNLIKDLKQKGVFESLDDWVRFKIKYSDKDLVVGTFENIDIYKDYLDYYLNNLKKSGIDYISGEEQFITEKLPSKIRNTGDNSRLISSNDNQGYTFRGRFLEASEAATLSFVLSQKAHNALRWLIQKQGYRNGSEAIVIFGVDNDTEIRNPLDEDFLIPLSKEVDTNEEFAKQVNKALNGWYPLKDGEREKVTVIALDTADGATQGRLAITYYNEFEKSDFKNNIRKWYSECTWILRKSNEFYIGTPNIRDIVNVAYGIQGNENYLKVTNDNLSKKTIDRLLPCIVQHKKIPSDIVFASVNNLNNPLSTDINLFDKKLRVTCALIKKYYKDYKKEEISMALDNEKNDKSYLFGRLLALIDDIESYAIYKEGSDRETNAKRYWSIYKRKPAGTFDLLREKLQSYLNKLPRGVVNNYENEVAKIITKLSENNSFNNNQLNEQFILGYYLQMDELRNSRKNNNKEMEENENE